MKALDPKRSASPREVSPEFEASEATRRGLIASAPTHAWLDTWVNPYARNTTPLAKGDVVKVDGDGRRRALSVEHKLAIGRAARERAAKKAAAA